MGRKMRTRDERAPQSRIVASYLLVVALMLSACSGAAEPAGEGQSAGDGSATAAPVDGDGTEGADATEVAGDSCPAADGLTFAVSAATPTLEPGLVNQALSTFLQPAYEPLIRRTPDGEYAEGLAVDWGYVGEGNTQFELELREGVTFSDGAELTADGVVSHFEYLQGTGAGQSSLLAGMTFEATGPLTVLMTMESPNPILEELLSQDWVIGLVVSPDALADPTALGTTTAGAGQYVLDTDRTIAGDRYVYTANPDYYDPEQVHFEEMTIQVVANPSSVVGAMQTGEIDVANGDFTTAQQARDAGLQVAAQPTVWQGLGLFDREGTLAEPLADQRVRQAINYAIDREAVAEALYAGDGVPSSQIALPGSVDHNDATADRYAHDPERARELLAEAGYADGVELTGISTGFANIGLAGQAIASQLADVGISLTLDEVEVNTYIEQLSTGQAAVAAVGLGSPPIHISATLALLPGGPFNPFQTADAQLMEWYTEAAATSDPQQRAEINQQIVAEVQEQAWFAPVVYTPVYYYAQSALGGLEVSPANPLVNPVEIFVASC